MSCSAAFSTLCVASGSGRRASSTQALQVEGRGALFVLFGVRVMCVSLVRGVHECW